MYANALHTLRYMRGVRVRADGTGALWHDGDYPYTLELRVFASAAVRMVWVALVLRACAR